MEPGYLYHFGTDMGGEVEDVLRLSVEEGSSVEQALAAGQDGRKAAEARVRKTAKFHIGVRAKAWHVKCGKEEEGKIVDLVMRRLNPWLREEDRAKREVSDDDREAKYEEYLWEETIKAYKIAETVFLGGGDYTDGAQNIKEAKEILIAKDHMGTLKKVSAPSKSKGKGKKRLKCAHQECQDQGFCPQAGDIIPGCDADLQAEQDLDHDEEGPGDSVMDSE
jgi:hypothetical protein